MRDRYISFGTWNINGFSIKKTEVFKEIYRSKINGATLTETKMTGKGEQKSMIAIVELQKSQSEEVRNYAIDRT